MMIPLKFAAIARWLAVVNFLMAASLIAQTNGSKNCIELEGVFYDLSGDFKKLLEDEARRQKCGILILRQDDTTKIAVKNDAVLNWEELDPYTRLFRVRLLPQTFYFELPCQKLFVDFSASQRVVAFRIRRVSPDLKLVHITGGTFEMGDQFGDSNDDERPAHTLTIDSFCMSEAEVTNAQFCEFLNDKSIAADSVKKLLDLESEFSLIQRSTKAFYTPRAGFADHPVVEITWNGAKAFCDWLSAKYLAEFRLPTEAEWEYAVRGGRREKAKYANGLAAISDTAGNFRGGLVSRTTPVRTYGPNPLGLYDMAGNVWEWCENWYDRAAYKRMTSDATDSTGFRALRGGSWLFSPTQVRVSSRSYAKPGQSSFALGFRVVMECNKE